MELGQTSTFPLLLLLFFLLTFLRNTDAQSTYAFSCFGSNCTQMVTCNQTVEGYQLLPFNMQGTAPAALFNSSCNPNVTVCARNNGLYRVYVHNPQNPSQYLQPVDDLFNHYPSLPWLLLNSHFTTPEEPNVMHVKADGTLIDFISANIPCSADNCGKPFSWVTAVLYYGEVNYAPYRYKLAGPYKPDGPTEDGYMAIDCVMPITPAPKISKRRPTRCYPIKPK